MKNKFTRFFKIFFSRSVILCIGICLGILLCRAYSMHTRTQSICREVEQLGMLVNNYHTALEREEEPVAQTYQQLRITSGAMTARLHDNYGAPPYDEAALRYLYGMAHYINKIALENLTAEEWTALFSDAEAAIKIYGMDLEDPNLLLDELDMLLEGKIFPAKFLTSYTILGNAEVDPF